MVCTCAKGEQEEFRGYIVCGCHIFGKPRSAT